MKKIILGLLIFAMILVAAACGDDDTAQEPAENGGGNGDNVGAVSENKFTLPELTGEPGKWEFYNKRAEFFIISMANGDFDAAVAMYCDVMAPLMPVEVTKDGFWDLTIAEYGEFIEIYNIENVPYEEYYICFVTSRHERSGVTLQFTFNEAGEVSGLFVHALPTLDELDVPG